MKLKHFLILFLLLGLVPPAFSQVKRYTRKGDASVHRGNLEAARKYYEKALAIDPEYIGANYGYGMMLCELLENYSKALPYLEKANQPPVEDSLYDLMFALGKCYHHKGEFEKAINYYDRLQYVVDLEEEVDFQKVIKKHKEDAQYAMAHRNEKPAENIHVVNGGRTINTEMPEYVPVLLPANRMLFTSKRKDSEKERINYLDGKYFESMYITEITPHGFRNTQRYTIPDNYKGKSKANKHESVISLSQDGSKLFTYKKGNIYQIDLNETRNKKPGKLETFVNKNIYENHAFLSRDHKQLFFSVETDNGLGGTDLYLSTLGADGSWSTPQNIGEPVNTSFDEDAPFLSDDGQWLYFASTGHKGFGNFDLYRSKKLDDGRWAAPENLGKPLNSPGHDIFLVNDSANATGYFASGRNGGFGDMDIYKVLYLDKIDTSCSADYGNLVSLEVRDVDSTDHSNIVGVVMPADYRVLTFGWQVNGEKVRGDTLQLDHDYKKAGIFNVSAKIVAICDTCLSAVVACVAIENKIPEIKSTRPDTTGTGIPDLADYEGVLSDEQLRAIGFNPEPVLFGFDKSVLTASFKRMLDSNIVVLKKYNKLKIRVVGYTDSRGPASYNKILSERRAKSVLNYLLKNGVNESKIADVKGKGESELVNDCDGTRPCKETEHKKNRRVRVVVISESIKP